MEILQSFKQKGYFTSDLYHLLTRKKLADASEEIIPSQYESEMRMSTSERLKNLYNLETVNIVRSGVKPEKIVLAFSPTLIVFQNFHANDKIVAKFSVKNISQSPTFLNMVFKESSYFSIKPCGGQLLSRLAPGISVTFAVTFSPVQHEDYIHRVTFNTDKDQFVLPLIAMGPRPIFNFPDEIKIPEVPLKVEAFVSVTIHNVGSVSAGFTLTAKCPFSIYPKSAYLHPDQKIEIKVGLKTMKLGEVKGLLYTTFETGEIFCIKLFGLTHTVRIDLEKDVVRFPDTYNTMVRQQSFKIINRSNHVLSYMGMKNKNVHLDFDDKIKLATICLNLKESESTKYTKLVQYDVLSSDDHERVYTRIFYDEIQALVADESLSFQFTHFSITPIKGKLWPNKATELTITFCPKEIGEFQVIAYLDMDGVIDRVPLKLVGTSLPPSISLNLETLDMDRVYISKTYNYEIIAINKGHINGVIVYKEVPVLFGSHITCTPGMHCLRPGEKEIFVISFVNSNQGPYFEEINFTIRETNVVLKLYLKGEVVYPSISFSIPCLDFGRLSLGVPKTLELEVINESVVHIKGTAKISSDGPEISSITLEDFAVADRPKPQVPQWPREFNIEPCKIDISPESRVSLKVTLTANLIRANQTYLELELEKSDSPPIVLPVTFNAMVPDIIPASEVKLRACFLDYPYQHEIYITSNEFRGYFTVEKPEEESSLEVDVGIKEGMIEPHTTLCLPVTIKTKVLGVQQYGVWLHLFGLSRPIEVCHITGCGVRPIVTCTPLALHWGQVKLLSKSQKILTLCNDSPVYVNFKASLLNRDNKWQIYPTEGFVAPEAETDLILNLYLLDAATYTNKALIQMEKVKDILVPLSATGVGTSIVVGDLKDRVYLGRHFTRIPLNCKVVMENCGTRLHALEWSEHYKAPKMKQHTAGFFNLDPKSFKIAAGEKIDLIITGLSYKVATVKEVWYLVGSVEGINKKELLLECTIVADFVDPKIEMSSTGLDFRYDYGPYSEYYKLTDIITIKNVSKLPLDIDINIKPPFAIIQKQDTYKVSPENENTCCCICYDENDLNIQKILNITSDEQSKVFIDFLTNQPVEPQRREPLNFFKDINKIKMAFNLTHIIEETLEDLEVMKIQILFDTTKHLSLKSKVYCDIMKIKFKGHKNKDAIKLTGTINFPNIFVLSPKVDFQCILNGSIESRTIKIQNITPLLVCYRLHWKKCIITTTAVAKTEVPISLYASGVTELNMVEQTQPSVNDIREIFASRSLDVSIMNKSNEKFLKEIMGSGNIANDVVSTTFNESFVDSELMKRKIIKLTTPMIDTDCETKFKWTSKLMKLSKHYKIRINDVLQLVPHKGLLKPKETQLIHVIFRPKTNINVKAILECEVLGGPSETIIVAGQSSHLMYKINTHKVNFKIRSFHECATEKLIVSNVALLPFEYKTYLNEPVFDNELEGTIHSLDPPEKVLEAEEEAEINIIMRPGVVGFFHRVFLLEIGHLPHIPIEVYGWGVIPQVYIYLPRPQIDLLDPEIGYLAISAITLDYLEAVHEFFSKGNTEHLNSPMTEKCFEDPDLQHDWHICSVWDGFPSTMDIELAIERMLIVYHIKLRPELLSVYFTTSKIGPISGFRTTPYVIDYGVVITGSTTQCIIDIINYGPISTKVHFAKGTCLPSWLSFKLCGKLNPGETGKIEVTFSPTTAIFSELQQNMETVINLEVPYGVSIPVYVKALCAVPYLVSNVKSIDFGAVRCGNKIICSIPLKNVGKPTCIWYVTLKLKIHGQSPMVVLDSSGKYEPGEGGWLSIAFKPTLEMVYEGLLIFRFYMNPNKLIIPVTGRGIVPQVLVIGPNVIFSPTLPWSKTIDIYFGLTNPCPFPIELIIAHSDEKWKEEDEVYQLLSKYYNMPEEMLVPEIMPGTGLPPEIMNFYRSFAETVKRSCEEEAASTKASAVSRVAVAKKAKSPKVTKSAPGREIKAKRTEAEIISDVINTMKENKIDPLKECLYVFDNISTETSKDERSKGIIVFFHGSPCEETIAQEMAYSLGKHLRIPTVNIDQCIVEALCVSNCSAKTILLAAINDMYSMLMITNNKESDGYEEENEEIFGSSDDEFDIILKKIEYLANCKSVGTPRSKVSDKKKKRSPTSSIASHTALGAMGSSTMFNMELIDELLEDFFNNSKYDRGFIVDTLTSMIFKSPPLVLTTVLKCKNSVRNIHLVLCQSDFQKWAHAYEESLRETEIVDENVTKTYDEAEIQSIVKSFENMDEEEYENAPQELKLMYIAHGLEERRLNHLLKKGILHENTVKDKKDASKILTLGDASESKKKIKKDDAKGKPTSEYVMMSSRYNEYSKNTYENLINIANNWIIEECELGYPIYGFSGQVVGAAQKKLKKKSELQMQMSEITYTDRGFPLTMVICPCSRYKEAVLRTFISSPIVKEALREEVQLDILKCPLNRKEFTVIMPKVFPTIHLEDPLKWRFLDELPIKKCECNQLTDLHVLDDTTQENVINILSKWHCTCGKKVTSSQTSTSEIPPTSLERIMEEDNNSEIYFCPLPLQAVNSVSAQGTRLVLHPGDLVRCKYSFSPEVEGNFSLKRYIEVSGWPDSRVNINVSGICDLPRLDSRPKKMFENFTRRTLEDHVYKITYLDDFKVFQFGPIFVGANRIYEEEYTIDLKNSSLITADTEIEFLEETNVFEIDKTFISLEPGCRGKLIITAAPLDVGVHDNVLLFCVNENPEIITVNIACSGVIPVVEILPVTKLIEYGKLLMYRREDDRFIIKNDSILPIMWKIRNSIEFKEDFIIGQTSGIVPSHENQVVPVTYIACNVGVISNKVLTIDIYDAEGRGDPMLVDTLYFSAECYDVMVDCAFENPAENYLNYGNVKVNSTVLQEMYLLNRGRYNIYYKLKKVKNFPEPSLLRTFEASSECGVIPPNLKLITIEFECTPTTSMNLDNVPAYICSLLDGSKDQVVVAKFPVCVTIASFYNTFTLFPLGQLNFHIIPVGSGVLREVILNNTSKCPVTYEIILPTQYQLDPNMPVVPIKGTNKIKNPPLRCGNFIILNEDNLLAPGTSRTIQIQFLATAARKFEETINFVVSDTCPAEAQGVPLSLVGTGAMPTLDFWNIETTFREHLIVKSLLEYKVPEPSPHCVFVEDSVTLNFFNVTVNTSHTGSIDLYNNGLVPCVLTMKLHYQNNSNQSVFYLNKYETHIEPLMHKILDIIFAPKALLEYRAVLEIKLKLLSNQEQSFKICLIGEGLIPRISLISPPRNQQRTSVLKFPVTCLGSTSVKTIKIKNITTVKSVVVLEVLSAPHEKKLIFTIAPDPDTEKMIIPGKHDTDIRMKLILKPEEIASINVTYNPLNKGKANCNIKITIVDNAYEFFMVECDAEAFMEDITLVGLKLLSMDIDLDVFRFATEGISSTVSTTDNRKKSKSAGDAKKSKILDPKKNKKSTSSFKHSDSSGREAPMLKYVLDFGGCELRSIQKRCVIMINNSEKVYKFHWAEVDNIAIKPSKGYISPGEEKDCEILFFAALPGVISKELLTCNLTAVSDDIFTMDIKDSTWDNRQTITVFDHNKLLSLNERNERILDEQPLSSSGSQISYMTIVVLYSAKTEFTKYKCSLKDEITLKDTFIYQQRKFEFIVENVGNVPLKINWNFYIEDEFPARVDKFPIKEVDYKKAPDPSLVTADLDNSNGNENNEIICLDPETSERKQGDSKQTLFSGSMERESVDTWFEVDLPFRIVPEKDCLNPKESRNFVVTFSPFDAFDYKVRLKGFIDNLDPYDQIISCKIMVRSLIPYCHLDIEESDYLTSGRRKVTGVTLPSYTTVLEFNVLGSGCYKKKFDVINPTSEGYEFVFEMVISDKPELIPVHCNMLKGYVEGGTSEEVTFTFSPTSPGVYESQWRFIISTYNLIMNLLVVGIVKEPDVVFVPTILIIPNSLVGFTTTNIVVLRNNENESLKFEYKGNSLCNESGENPIVVEPKEGLLKPYSETPIQLLYTPLEDGPLSFKLFFNISYMTKYLTLCVNALSLSIKPKVTYYLIGNEHVLRSDAETNIHLDQTASTYERKIPFKIKNDGSATFFFDWYYSSSGVKKYMQIDIEPKSGRVTPANEIDCTIHFTLKQVQVQAFPITLSISDGPEYVIYLHADIKKPLYYISCMEYDFGKCIINAPDVTYKKNIAIMNNDKESITIGLDFENVPELFVDYKAGPIVMPDSRLKISIFFRPKQVKEYEFKLQFWVNSLCEEIVTVRGEGVPLLYDLYEGCQKSFDLGPVKVGSKIVRQIEVMNHSKVPIDATFIFRDMYPEIEDTPGSETTSVCLSPSTTILNTKDPGPSRCVMLRQHKNDKIKAQIEMDIKNALSSLKVIPNKFQIQPHKKVPLKIQFKPVGIISSLDVQLNMKVFEFERPLVRLSGSATGMSLCFSQNSLQFGRVRKRGCKILKVMLVNNGDFGAKFVWQPLISDEFTISPMQGQVAARASVTFTIAFRPINHNPFIKVWASCKIENYKSLEIVMYGTCVDLGNMQNKTLYIDCPVREIQTGYIVLTNPSDDVWLILSEVSGGPFETLKEFNVEPNSTFDVPIYFKPKTVGKHEGQVLFSPLGETALFVTLIGTALHPNPNGNIVITVSAKENHTEELLVYNITEEPESYSVLTELVKVTPDKFNGYYEIKHPDTIKVWGEAAATCRWSFACYEECDMNFKVLFINQVSREYQFYLISVNVTASKIVATIKFVSRAREVVQEEILVKNPLDEDADFNMQCEKLDCPDIINITKKSEARLLLTYSPLVVGVTEEILTVTNYLVGTYFYKVLLKCLPAKQKNLEFTTPLGTSIPIRLRVQNKTDVSTDFTSTVSHSSMVTEREYTLGPFEKGKFLVWFEPIELGVQNCQVSFNSPVAGEFIFNIKGRALKPKPKGPYLIKPGGFVNITFKNVFEDTRMFKIYTDRDEFYVKSIYEPVRGKKDLKVTVYLIERPPQDWSELPAGCLTIETYDPSEPKVHWTYFLQGVP